MNVYRINTLLSKETVTIFMPNLENLNHHEYSRWCGTQIENNCNSVHSASKEFVWIGIENERIRSVHYIDIVPPYSLKEALWDIQSLSFVEDVIVDEYSDTIREMVHVTGPFLQDVLKQDNMRTK